jgi:predicted membrane protein
MVGMAPGVPTNLVLELGVGTSRIDLSRIDVRDLRVISGVGEAVVDLTGPREADVSVDIDTGVGSLTVKLPRDVGVRVEGGADGIGDLTADGLTKEGTAYVNAAWSKPGPKMTVRVTRGVGELKLVSQP